MKKYLIKSGTIFDGTKEGPKDGVLGDILIDGGVIKEVDKQIKPELGVEVIDASGKAVTPGLFDMHVHLREPGREDKETIETAMKAAIKGGITSILAMPNTNPLTDNQMAVEYQLSTAQKLGLINLFVAGRITREGQVAEMWEMKQKGAVAFTDDGEDVVSAGLMRNALDWANTFDMPILCHSEEKSLAEGHMNEGITSLKLGVAGIARSAENIAIQRNLMLAQEGGARVHISHVSTREGVEFIRQAKKAGVRVTAEATPHHFSLTEEACLEWNTNAKVNPPLREEADRQAVIEGLKDGTIDCIASDHAPHLASEKLLPFNDAPYGMVGLETMVAAANTYLVRKGLLSFAEVVNKMTCGPAKALGLPVPAIAKGKSAEIAVFDLSGEWMVNPDTFESKGKNSAFAGQKLVGEAEYVFSRGKLLLAKGQLSK